MSVGQAAYEAWCKSFTNHGAALKEWESLGDNEQGRWIAIGWAASRQYVHNQKARAK